MREIDILYIPSHRQLFNYKRTPNLLTQKMERKAVFSEYKNATDSLYTGHHYGEPVSFLMKNALLSWAINGYGVTDNNSNTIMQADVSQAENFEGFRNVLKTLLPESLGFENLSIRDYEIIFSCNNGRDEFLLENASGGIAALIDIAWRIFNFNVSSDHPFFVMIDEAENHLHPSMQRSLLPKLLTAFPHIKFIITTHSPLIVTSIEDASIYVLKHNSQQKIESLKLNASKEVCNIIEILDQILGVSTTIPIWASKKFNSILEQHLSKDITKDSISALRSELETAGLSRLFPNAIGTIAESRE